MASEHNTAQTAYIAVGSNIEPEQNILKGLGLLAQHVPITAVSTFYRTEALGRPEQPSFLNGACAVLTYAEPRRLKFDILRCIEDAVGRVRMADKYAPRPLDLDIALYGGIVADEDGLQIPDPDIRKRPFLAVPLLELAPEAVLPDSGERLADIVGRMATSGLTADEPFTETLKARLRI